jgi:hypothetical protein
MTRYTGVRVARRFGLLVLVAMLLGLSSLTTNSLAASRSSGRAPVTLHLRFVRSPGVGAPVAVRGHYALFRTARTPGVGYLLFDDRTGRSRRLFGGCGDPLLGPPWVLYDCGAGSALYDITTRKYRTLHCGLACDSVGDTQADGIGSHWIVYNENAHCNHDCQPLVDFVRVPSGTERGATLSRWQYIDLNSLSLVRRICSPLRPTATGLWAFYGRVGLTSDASGLLVQPCGSRRQTRVFPNPTGRVVGPFGTATAIIACDEATNRFAGLFLPSLRRFAFSLPASISAGCFVQLGAGDLFVGSWHARFPTH